MIDYEFLGWFLLALVVFGAFLGRWMEASAWRSKVYGSPMVRGGKVYHVITEREYRDYLNKVVCPRAVEEGR